MRAMILAAGRGERLRPLTDTTPKPLLRVGGAPLIVRHLRRLQAVGVTDVVINVCHLAEKIIAALGDGAKFGLTIHYSKEKTRLSAAGGIRQAQHLGLLPDPFILVNGDVYCDYPLENFLTARRDGVQLLLVDNPPHHPQGDFSLTADGALRPAADDALTYAGMGVFNPALFAHLPVGEARDLKPIITAAIAAQTAGGQHYGGRWFDIGRAETLASARRLLGNGRK